MSKSSPPEPSTEAKFEMVESEDGRGAWIRSWPEGFVHYFPNHTAVNQAICGRFLTFWPDYTWPRGELCSLCEGTISETLAGHG